jgi:hypothetical protein
VLQFSMIPTQREYYEHIPKMRSQAYV